MKKGIIVTVAVLSFFIVVINSNAEMKITPGGVTSPDDSATLNLSGSAYGAAGPAGAIISGENSYSGASVSCGGYFSASGTDAYGVYSKATGVSGRGVYGSAIGISGKGVSGSASGSSGYGVSGVASGSSGRGVYGYGTQYDFYAGGPGVNYGSFTGAHEVKFSGDKAVFGVIVSRCPLPEDHWYEAEKGEHFGVANALGEGRVWVTARNGEIRAGDYITTSEIPGYGQMQDDDLLHSYTLGKAIETIDWEQVSKTIRHEGRMYKAYLIAVVYTSG